VARIGLISDTHGLLRPQAVSFLRGCDHIIHGGDIGRAEIVDQLSSLAPVTAVRGNNDRGPWAERFPEAEFVRIGEVFIYALHDVALLDLDPAGAGVHVVVSGHSHKPSVQRRNGVLYVNPGSAGPRRFTLPISVAELIVTGGEVSARLVELATDAA
jgi:hypothetical protein